MLRSTQPLNDQLGINHFWYYKLTHSGHYSYLGTHTAWSEFCFNNGMVQSFPCLRHPNILQPGLSLMKSNQDKDFKTVLDTAWEKFRINFNINLLNQTADGIEAFGFASRYNDPFAEERLLNELPLLMQFTKVFRTENKKLFDFLEDNQVDLSSEFGMKFYQRGNSPAIPCNREEFIRKMGYESFLSLTSREKDILRYMANGYPASYIATELKLGKRTIETYMDKLKMKFDCDSKVDLIKKAKEFVSIFDSMLL
jgi:DNA-binding CsgD family transcriptional regulator